MIVATALGWGDAASIALSVVLAFCFGYALTMVPLFRAKLPLRKTLGLAFASDTLSITTMEITDNLFLLLVPGALAAPLTSSLFWLSLAASLLVAFVVTVPVNRYLLIRGRGHAVLHGYH